MSYILWLEFHQWDVLGNKALVTNPLGVDLLSQEVEGRLVQPGADAVEPEVATGLAEDGLIIVLDLLVAYTARIDRRCGWILRIEHHWLAWRVDLLARHGS